jgi:hypothetical protein
MQPMSWPAGRPLPPFAPAARSARRTLLVLATATGLIAASASAADAAQAAAAANAARFGASADAAVDHTQPQARFGTRGWLMVDGSPQWRSYLRFRVRNLAGPVTRATLVLQTAGRLHAPLEVRVSLAHDWHERKLDSARAPRVGARVGLVRSVASCRRGGGACTVAVDVTRAIPGNGTFDFVLTSRGSQSLRLASREASRGRPRLVVRTGAPAAAAPAPTSAPRAMAGIWTTPAELASRPMSGPAWKALKAAADGGLGQANIADQNSQHDVDTLGVALVYARTGIASYRAKAAAAIASAIGTERGGRTLALGRNLASYVIAADLVGLSQFDPALDARFRAWLSAVRTESLDGLTLIETHEKRPNNWGTMAGASREAVDVYLGDTADLDRAAKVFDGWAGDRSAYAGFDYGDLSWQTDPRNPVGVLPAGATMGGLAVDGAMPDDMRRGCGFSVPPCHTNYAWEAMQGAVVQATILSRRGYDAWNWQNRAILRAVSFISRLDGQYGSWWAATDDEWQPWIINRVYGTRFPTRAAGGPGKIMGWTDWSVG